mmetsp:Transcript_4114/g.6369  ORF Transcript_4114/g.6369 Transcript_4114/m.6369 type:complete len:558 (-) Transcript_4114:134-1807(-)|eukprot:CAMPEP_0185036612 /NCGR_PEP_ID=MMETSP1103-20130426/29807_1 /TAXON_ID=36769 /ORGANISM="Paraphysomonas bandaiensis, Strain Caron Lab Isolate" /LENGTH=557 /DNA_ID=CAMNT_0027574207 /DNA_START=151 /DNA_END=1824 /DNA_ORIENTATION=+
MSFTASFSYNRFSIDDEIERCTQEVFETVWASFSSEIDVKWVKTLEIPLSTEIAMHKLHEVVHLATFMHDGNFTEGVPLEHFTPDKEPVPIPVDNWARGAVPIRHIAAVDDTMYKGDMGSDGTRTPSVSSMRSSTTGRTKSSSSSHHRGASRGGVMRTDFHDNSPKIIELDDEYSSVPGDSGNINGTGYMYDMLQKANNRLKKQAHADDDVKDEFQTLEEEVQRAAAELKGKKYAFDQNGKPITISVVKPDSLPPYAYQPSLNVNTESSSDSLKKGKKTKKKIRVAGSRSVDHPQFLPTASLATALSSHASISLNPGVTLQSGDIIREGPVRSDDPKKPSRKEFFNRQAMARSTASSLDMSNRIDPSSPWYDSEGASPTVGSSTDVMKSGGSMLSTKDNVSASGFSTGARYKDIDPMEGARKISPQQDTESADVKTTENIESEDNSIKQRQYSRTTQPKRVVSQPIKPTQKQREIVSLLHGGTENAGPRDRISHHALESRRKITFAEQHLPRSLSPTGSLMQNSALSNGNDSLSATSHSVKGGSVKHERLDIAREIF